MGKVKAFRCIIAAIFAFYSILSGFAESTWQLGLPAPAMALPMSFPIDRECTEGEQQFTLVADTDMTVRITNSTKGRINVIGIDGAGEQQLLTELRPGEVRAQKVPQGINLLGFANAEGWLGDGYAVTGAGGEAVTVPYQAPETITEAPAADSALAAMIARQQGQASVEIGFTNTTADAATVVVVDDANAGYPLFDVPAGATVLQRVLPAAKLWFFKAGTQDLIGGPYIVQGIDGEVTTIAPPAAEPQAPALSEMQLRQQGEGSVELSFTNTTADQATVVVVDDANAGHALFDVPAGETVVQRALPAAKLWFYKAGTQDVISGPYDVLGIEGEVATIAPAAAEPQAPAMSEMQLRQQGEGSVELSFTNSTVDPATVVVVDDANAGHALFDVAAGETVLQRALPDAKLWFYKAGTQDVISGPYVVLGIDGEVATITPPAAEPQAPTMSEMQLRQQGEGSVELTFTNATADPATVVVVDDANAGFPLFDVAGGETVTQRALPAAKLWFYKAGTQDVISGPYGVLGIEGEVIIIAPMAEPEAPALTEMQLRQQGEGSVAVSFTNTTTDPATVVVVDDANTGHVLFDVAAGETAVHRVLPAAKLWFYKFGTQDLIGGSYAVTGAADEVATIPAPEPKAAELTPTQIHQSGEGSVEIAFTNTLDVALVVAIPNEANELERLFSLPAGQSSPGRARPGTVLGFYRADTGAAAGSGYTVKGSAGESLSLPFDAAAAAKTEQAGPGSMEVRLSNRRNYPVTVAVAGADGLLAKLYDVPAQAQDFPARILPGTEVWFVREETVQAEGEKVKAEAGIGYIAVPYYAAIAKATKVIDVRFTNRAEFDISAVTQIDGKRAPLFDVAAGGVADLRLPPETQVWFLKAGTDENVPQSYIVPETGPELVELPYVQLSAEARRQSGPGSIEVRFVNPTSDNVAVTTLEAKDPAAVYEGEITEEEAAKEAERITLFTIPAGQTVNGRLQPGATLWFYRGETNQFAGRSIPYFVRAVPNETVRLPYNPTDKELIELTNISIDQVIQKFVDKKELEKAARVGPDRCWKDSYGRGVGTIPRVCPPGQEEATAGLCYDKCRAGYKGAVTMCVPSCPAGFRDDGLYCFKPAPYNKTAYPWEFGDWFNMDGAMARCRASAEGRKYGCDVWNSNTMVYTGCPSGFRTIPGLSFICSPICPSNTTDIGISCQKNTYDRGVGKLMSCEQGKQWDAGLCYNQCDEKSVGIGPVCWNKCPADISFNCGGMCARDSKTCDSILQDQILGPVFAVGSVVLTVVTAGGSTAATASAKAGATVAKTGAQLVAKAAAKELAKKGLIASTKAAVVKTAQQGFKTGAKYLAVDTVISFALADGLYAGQHISAAVGRANLRATLLQSIPNQIVGEVSDDRIEATVDAMMAGAEKNAPNVDFPYSALDPTGIADIVIAYNHPLCSALPARSTNK